MVRQTHGRPAGPLAAACVSLAAGLLLLWLAIPRTVAHARLVPGDPVMAALSQGQRLAPRHLLAAISTRREALAWLDLPDARIDMGALYLALARLEGLPRGDRAALLDRSIGYFEGGLRAAPSRPFAWTQLAQARHMKDPESEAVEPLLRMSMATGPHEPRLISQRVRIGYAARASLSPEIARRIAREVGLWARHDPWRLADWARPQFALPWVRRALKEEPALDRRFMVNYLRLPPR